MLKPTPSLRQIGFQKQEIPSLLKAEYGNYSPIKTRTLN